MFQLIFGFKYPVCSQTREFIHVVNFQFEHVLCKLVVKGHVVFWGQLTRTGDPGSEAQISQIPQVYENFLYQRIVTHSMQTLVITQSLFITYNTRRKHTTFTQCYEIACIWFNSQCRVRAYHKNTLSTDFVALMFTPQTSLLYTSTSFISDWKRYIMILIGRAPMFFNRLNMANTAWLALLHRYW